MTSTSDVRPAPVRARAAVRLRRLGRRASLVGRALVKIAWGLAHRHHPILVHVIPMRRCNLACVYCNEFDDVSKPVPLEEMKRRVDKLAELGTACVTISGGEPLMHPDLDEVIAHVRRRGIVVTLITNGYYLNRERIERLNRAGLDHLEISIDNVEPDEVSKKSLRLLEPKLRWLAEHAEFSININSVVGSGIRNPEDALEVARRASELGFMRSIGVIHDGEGQLRPLGEREMGIYRTLRGRGGLITWLNSSFQENLAGGRANEWRCRAGARYLYVDEGGLVHYCSQQRGAPAVPLAEYTREHIRREYGTKKGCAPYCTVNCVQQVGLFDNWRSPQKGWARLPVHPAAAAPAAGHPVPAAAAEPPALTS